jgi:hypothetical protein
MTALQGARRLIDQLEKRHVPYQLLSVRPEALMVCVAVPGERWEIEFFDDDDSVLVERFVTAAVEEPFDVVSTLMAHLEK